MPPRVVRIPGIEPLELPVARASVPPLHAYLRGCILDGRIPPGTKLSQATLAKQLCVSRTPLREVLRMLQEEGLVTSEPNQRMRVAGLDPMELDYDYASRILLGSLALSMAADEFSQDREKEATRLLDRMRITAEQRDVDGWIQAHTAYHRVFDSAAPEPLQRQLRLLADRSVRYIRLRQIGDPVHWSEAGDLEHPSILRAVTAHERDVAVSALADHLAGTALRVLADSAPTYVPTAVPRAVELVRKG